MKKNANLWKRNNLSRGGADAIIGNRALKRFNLIFDYANKKLHLKPNKDYKKQTAN
jgi:hypothetical protein